MTAKVLFVAGARPNFPKIAPILSAMSAYGDRFERILVHTGQHYDFNMSRVFFQELDLPQPDDFLNVGSGSIPDQTARVLQSIEPVLARHVPDLVMVVGDVNSTLAAALACAQMQIPVAHVEAGLRSFDRTMPEEINRLLTDQASDLLFTPSPDGDRNLLREGIAPEKIHFVGNVMIDTLVRMLPLARRQTVIRDLGLEPGGYILVTLHRPSNVDHPKTLAEIAAALQQISAQHPVIFPIHPRTSKNLEAFGLSLDAPGLKLLPPQGYLDFIALEDGAGLVLTDSGGIQEETSYLGVPCLTARPNTERPITIEQGTNQLVKSRADAILAAVAGVPFGERSPAPRIDRWDGRAAERIAAVVDSLF